MKTLAQMTEEIRTINVEKGWRPAEGGPGVNTFGDYLALLHSEVSEALEAYRDHRLADATDYRYTYGRENEFPIPKPEGVGAELADVLIRAIDTADVFGVKLREMSAADSDASGMESFGDYLAWLHWLIATLPDPGNWDSDTDCTCSFSELVQSVYVVAARHEIDLDAEYERKIAYNRTRPYQHGGRTLHDDLEPISAP